MPVQRYFVYMMTNIHHSVLYIGMCNDLEKRVYEHKNKLNPNSFTAKYNLFKLVYFEECSIVNDAIAREKQLKKLLRKKKNDLIELENKEWKDLSVSFKPI